MVMVVAGAVRLCLLLRWWLDDEVRGERVERFVGLGIWWWVGFGMDMRCVPPSSLHVHGVPGGCVRSAAQRALCLVQLPRGVTLFSPANPPTWIRVNFVGYH